MTPQSQWRLYWGEGVVAATFSMENDWMKISSVLAKKNRDVAVANR
jgi:hypothetical protein